MAPFDEAAWRSATEWQPETPSLGTVWKLLSDPSGDPNFIASVADHLGKSETLRAGFVQDLADSGLASDQVLQKLRDALQRNIRETTLTRLLQLAPTRRRAWNNNFANLVSGRFTELVFQHTYGEALGTVGVILKDATTDRSFLDYELLAADESESFALSINVKNAGRQMRKAYEFFGLEPDDTLPMATYKAFGAAAAGIPPLLYVYLVDWTLLERLRAAYWLRTLRPAEQEVFRLMTTFQGFPRNLEDAFVAATVDRRLDRLLAEVGYADLAEPPFRVVSAARCHAIFYEHHERSPYVFIKRMETDPNVHISVNAETIPFQKLIDEHLASPALRAELLRGLARTKTMDIPNPPI